MYHGDSERVNEQNKMNRREQKKKWFSVKRRSYGQFDDTGMSGNMETEAPSRNAMKTHNMNHNEKRLMLHTFKSKLKQSKVHD